MSTFAGWKRGDVGIVKLACSDPRSWLVHCDICGSEWSMQDRAVRNHVFADGGNGVAIPCRLNECRMGRLQPMKITAHEQWLTSPDEPKPQPIPEPVKAQPMRVEKPIRIFGRTGWSAE